MFVTGPMFNDSSGGFLGDFIISNYKEGRNARPFGQIRLYFFQGVFRHQP
jgi:hypothetical protein